jgi:hypothetical protein
LLLFDYSQLGYNLPKIHKDMIVSVNELIEKIGDAEYQQYLIDSELTINELVIIDEYAEMFQNQEKFMEFA